MYIKKVKAQTKKIFAMHITKEGLVSKYIKIFYKSIKIKNIIRKHEPRR